MRICCYIDPFAVSPGLGDSCRAAAVWQIYWEEPGKASYDCTTDACVEHVAAMLNIEGVREYHVYPIDESEGTVDAKEEG